MSTFKWICFVSVLFVLNADAAAAPKAEGPLVPTSLRCEYLVNPTVVDVSRPRFSWLLNHSQRGQHQGAYQVIVSAEPSCETGDQWDSGRVESGDSIQVAYRGKALRSNRTYYWKVRYWDRQNRVSDYSEIAQFDSGLLLAEDWKAQWIGGNRQLRKAFKVDGKIVRARAFVSALGYYELHLNGERVGEAVLDPGWTEWEHRILYSSYDVTKLIASGPNVIGAFLGQGWYGTSPKSVFPSECEKCRALLLQLEIETEDGRTLTIASDSTWKAISGPIVADHLFNGETYDARLESPGWQSSSYDDSSWHAVEIVNPPGGVLSAQTMQPIKVVDTIVPFKMTNPAPGVYVFDMGQNFTGWVQLRVQGSRGTRVQLRHSELLYENGGLNRENLRTAKARDVYILRGEGEEIFEPRFTYHGFRYVELTGFPGVPTLDSIRGKVVHTAVAQTGSFSSSNTILSQLQRIIIWGQKTNLHSIPTDCPQRNERMGWLGDVQVTIESAMLNFDMAAFYTNYIRVIRDAQGDDGSIPDTVPKRAGAQLGDPAWGAAYPLLCWYMYQYYGDRRVLEENYEALKKYLQLLESKTENGLLAFSHYGDWVSVENTPQKLVSSFYYYYDIDIMARIAEVIGKPQEAAPFRAQADTVKVKFNETYLDNVSLNYLNGTQTANSLPLFLDLVPEKTSHRVFRNLRNDIVYSHDTHVTTGFIGVKYLMEVLTNYGHTWLAYELATQTTYPSWGYMLENGATTLWEIWQNKTGPLMNSHNHPMLGSVGSWFYKALAGINLDSEGAGFEKILVAPHAVRDLRHAAGSIETVRGRVSSSWEVDALEDTMTLRLTIPVNSEAEVLFPQNREDLVIREGGREVWKKGTYLGGLPGLFSAKKVRSTLYLYQDPVSLKVGSGEYVFEVSRE